MSEHHARQIAFDAAPCRCVRYHVPKPLVAELHHTMPQADQRRAWGAVLDQRTVSLCGSGHDNVHRALAALLAGEEPPAINPYLRGIAQAGYGRILAARAGARPGDPAYEGSAA